MANFKIMHSDKITGNSATFDKVTATEYENLPIAGVGKTGVVSVDGKTIVIDESGRLKAQVVFEDEGMNEHIEDKLLHVSEDDRNNLAILNIHLGNSKNHFTFGEKESMKESIGKSLDHIKTPHLTSKEASKFTEHIDSNYLHFDNDAQKSNFIKAMNESVNINQSLSNKILITDENKKVMLSTIDATVLKYLEGITKPLCDILDDYSRLDHIHDIYLDKDTLKTHTNEDSIHFLQEEKEQLRQSIEDIKNSLESFEVFNDEILDLKVKLSKSNEIHDQRKLKVRYIRDKMYSSQEQLENNQTLKWVNCAIYKDGANIALSLPESSVMCDPSMNVTDVQKLAYINGDTENVSVEFNCESEDGLYVKIDLGTVVNGISHIIIHHAIGESFEQSIEVSEDGERWYTLFDTDINRKFEEDKYGKIHILNYEAYMDLYVKK